MQAAGTYTYHKNGVCIHTITYLCMYHVCQHNARSADTKYTTMKSKKLSTIVSILVTSVTSQSGLSLSLHTSLDEKKPSLLFFPLRARHEARKAVVVRNHVRTFISAKAT